MDRLNKAKKITELAKLIVELEEKKARIKNLNRYNHELEDHKGNRPFFVEFGGGCVHTKYYIESNDIGNTIECFFFDIFDKIISDAQKKLDSLIVWPVK